MLTSQSKVLLTGGTGFTGGHLLKALYSMGCEIRAICRPTSNREAFLNLDIQWYEGDVYDADVVNEAAKDVTHIFHLAAAYRQSGIENEEYWNTHVRSTKLLATCALQSNIFEKFIHVSTVGVLGHIEKPPADETALLNPGDIYQNTKTEAEQWILAFMKKHNLPLTVVRPAAIYGPGDRRLLKLFKLAKLPYIPLIGFTKGLYHLIHVQDLVRFMIHTAGENQTNGQVYICGSPEATSIQQMIKVIALHLNRKPRFLRIPAWPVFIAADLCESICRIVKMEPPIYRRRVAFFTKDRSFNTQKMRTQGKFEPNIPDEQGLQDLADWYREKGWL